MKTFKRIKTFAEVKAQCDEQALHLDDDLYLYKGYDTIKISSASESRDYAIYNTVSGRFFGITDKCVRFTSDLVVHENEDWFQALLAFFYVEKDHG